MGSRFNFLPNKQIDLHSQMPSARWLEAYLALIATVRWKAPTGLITLGLGTRRFGGPENRGFAVSWQERFCGGTRQRIPAGVALNRIGHVRAGNNCARCLVLALAAVGHLVTSHGPPRRRISVVAEEAEVEAEGGVEAVAVVF